MRAKLQIGLLSSLLALPAQAQDAGDIPEEPEIRRYTVELIVFRYRQDVGTGSEVFLPDEPEPVAEPPDEPFLVIEEPADQPEEEPEALPDPELVLLLEDDYELLEQVERLERLDAYEPLMHFGWTQATWPEERTEPQPLHRFGVPPDGLDGNLTLYLSRFLHLVVDLQLEAPRATDAGPAPPTGDYPAFRDDGQFETPGAVHYRIRENRIVRNGELRYFDHPKFGVLARVTRVEEEPEEAVEVGELLGYPLE